MLRHVTRASLGSWLLSFRSAVGEALLASAMLFLAYLLPFDQLPRVVVAALGLGLLLLALLTLGATGRRGQRPPSTSGAATQVALGNSNAIAGDHNIVGATINLSPPAAGMLPNKITRLFIALRDEGRSLGGAIAGRSWEERQTDLSFGEAALNKWQQRCASAIYEHRPTAVPAFEAAVSVGLLTPTPDWSVTTVQTAALDLWRIRDARIKAILGVLDDLIRGHDPAGPSPWQQLAGKKPGAIA